MIDKRLIKNLDLPLLGVVLGITTLGILAVYSATHSSMVENGGNPYYFAKQQVVGALIGLIAIAIVINFDYRGLDKFTPYIYIGNLVLLGVTLVVGKVVSGAQSWLSLGPLSSFQPSEIAKIAIIVTLAKHLEAKRDLQKLTGLLSPFIHVGIPMALILLQPDLGTAMVFVGILFGMLLIGGARPKHLLGIILIFAALSPLVYFFVLKDYQQARIMTFINPYADSRGSGYNVIQAMIAVGSGRFFGKGLFSGTQTQLNFVPEHHTDFIFSVVGEELGFIGSVLLLGGYFFIVWRGIRTISHARESFGALLATGIVSMMLFHIMINVGMNVGIMPVTGIPLPFMSFGRSSLVTNLIGIGLLLNIYMRRQKILF
ncbi:MAG: rod shape-determining protein RodA [Syntrophothermus sp.]